MFAITVQQSVAIVIALVVLVGWLLWLVANVRRARPEIGAELELAANRKPLPTDEEMEGKRLDSVLRWALLSLTIIAVALPLYWLAEPGRQSGAIANFQSTFEHRGEGLYATTAEGGFDCAGCHGGVAGGYVPYTLTEADGTLRQVQWYAPSLDDVTLRMDDDALREVLVYGRPFSPMPGWGLDGGGPLNEQQVDNLIAYLHSVTITPQEARERNESLAQAELDRLSDLEGVLADLEAQLDAADPDDDVAGIEALIRQTEMEIELAETPTMGAALFNLHCARCHTQGWSWREPTPAGSGAFGPPLSNVVAQFPLEEDHYDFVADGRSFGQRYGVQGKASGRMPYYSQVLTEDQIQAIVDYERSIAERAAEGQDDQ